MHRNAKLILDIINDSKEHLTAEQIYMKLHEKGEKMVLATVYNNLTALCSEGLVRKVCIDGHPDQYDKTVRHDHLVCRECGKLTDIYFKDITELLQSQTDEGIISYDLQVSYICPDCRERIHR
jgi:Fe2+ or Zn2+ uptake regulation protein